MLKFEYHNPIQMVFGEDAFEKIPEVCQGHKVMLVYGGGSIKKNGVYDAITSLLDAHNVPFVDYGGHVQTTYQSILDGIDLVHRENVDAIIEVGGASAMDLGKAIAFGAVHDGLENYIEGRKTSDGKHLLNIVIPTYPSTGSEGDAVCDIMAYKGGGTELFGAWPDYCLMKPSVTLSLDQKSTTYSMLVSFIQTSGWYLGNHQNEIAKGFAATVLKVLLRSIDTLQEEPDNMKARENLMWASCVNTMGIFRSGIDVFYPWSLFSVGYMPRVMHGVSYREALAVAYPIWLREIAKYHWEDVRSLLTEVFKLDATMDDAALVDAGCERIKGIMNRGGVPQTLASYGSAPTLEDVETRLAPEDFGDFSHDEMYRMVAECYA